MKRLLGLSMTSLALLLWAAPAGAQDEEQPQEEAQQDEAQRTAFDVRVRGGFGGYTGSYAPLTSVGVMWGVSVSFKTATYVELELAYEGSQNGLQDRPGSLVRSGGFILGKLFSERAGLYPYLGAGLGISFVDPSEQAAPFATGDTVIEVPLVLGVDWRTGVLSFGVRAGYSLLVGERFLQPISPDGQAGFASGSFLFGLGF